MATGRSVVVHDFAPLGVPVDASVQADLLAARIGDSLHVVDLTTGAMSTFADTSWVLGAIAFSPDGRHIAAELARKPQLNLIDLYLFELP